MKPNEYILGIDVGASAIKSVLWHQNRVIKQKTTTNITAQGITGIIDYFAVNKVGIGFPGIIDRDKNIVIYCPSAPQLNGLNVNSLHKSKISADNDTNCLLRAEHKLGFAKNSKNTLAIAFGTGIGGATMINGKIYNGHTGSASEFGHMMLNNNQTWEVLYQKSRNNREKQMQINALGIAGLINCFNPELIIIGGGANIKLPKSEQISLYVNSPMAKKTKIIHAKYGAKAQAIGAAMLY